MPSLNAILEKVAPIWKYRVVIFVILGIAGAAGVYAYIHHVGYTQATADIEVKTQTKAVSIREEQNNARNHRPDTDALVQRLRSGSF